MIILPPIIISNQPNRPVPKSVVVVQLIVLTALLAFVGRTIVYPEYERHQYGKQLDAESRVIEKCIEAGDYMREMNSVASSTVMAVPPQSCEKYRE